MTPLLKSIFRTAARDTKRRARALALKTALAAVGGLVALAGMGFLMAWLFMTLSLEIGPRWAALFIGLGLFGFAGILLFIAANTGYRPPPRLTADNRSAGFDASAPDGSAVVAFTAAFVLARYLTAGKRN